MAQARAHRRSRARGLGLALAAPVLVAHTHVHSIRLASGPEALVARVLDAAGNPGYGFSLAMEPARAREMAAWDLHARNRRQPLWKLLGGEGAAVPVAKDDLPALRPDWETLRRAMLEERRPLLRIDPFAWESLEQVLSIRGAAAPLGMPLALLAPNAHPWEIAWCASLAGEGTRIVLRIDPPVPSVSPSSEPGIGVDWASEPAFASIRWTSLSPSPAA